MIRKPNVDTRGSGRRIHAWAWLLVLCVLALAACDSSSSSTPAAASNNNNNTTANTTVTPTADAWTLLQVNPNFSNVLYGNGTYVAIADNGTIATSSNGTTWSYSRINFNLIGSPQGAYSSAGFAVLMGGLVAKSTNGTSWTVSAVNPSGTCGILSFTEVASDGTLYYGVASTKLCSSTDGVTWTTLVTLTSGTFSKVAAQAGMGAMAWESTGQFWVRSGSTYLAAPVGGSPIALGAGTIGSTPVLVALNKLSTTIYSFIWNGSAGNITTGTVPANFSTGRIIYGGSKFVASGGLIGGTGISFTGMIMTSTDAVTWTAATFPASISTKYMAGIATNGSGFVAAGVQDNIVSGDSTATTWTSQKTGATPITITSLGYDGTHYVAFGPSLTTTFCNVYTSTDLSTWLNPTTVTDCPTGNSLAQTASKWVALGPGSLAVSTDLTAATWTTGTMGGAGIARSVGGNVYLLADAFNAYSTSANTLTSRPWSTSTAYYATMMATDGAGTYVAAGINGLAISVLRSSDQVTWTAPTTMPPINPNAIAYGGTKFVIVGATNKVIYSADGITWTAATGAIASPTITWNDVIHDGIRFIAVGSSTGIGAVNAIATSTDGNTWTLSSPSGQLLPLARIATNGTNIWVAVGGGSGTPAIFTNTSNPTTAGAWVDHSPLALNPYFDLAWVPSQSRFVAEAGSAVQASTDGITWTTLTGVTGGYLAPTSTALYIFGSGALSTLSASNTQTKVFTGGGGAGMRFLNSMLVSAGGTGVSSSPDGAVWTSSSLLLTLGSSTSVQDVAFGGGTYVAVSGSSSYTSTDLVTWTAHAQTAGSFVVDPFAGGNQTVGASIVYGGGKFVAYGGAGVPYASSDGVIWTAGTGMPASSTLSVDFSAPFVMYDGSKFLIVRKDGVVLVSSDGLTWKGYDTQLPAILSMLAANPTGYVGVGFSGLLGTRATHY